MLGAIKIITARSVAAGAALSVNMVIDKSVFDLLARSECALRVSLRYASGGVLVDWDATIELDGATVLMPLNGERLLVDAFVPLRRRADRGATMVTQAVSVVGPGKASVAVANVA